MALIQLMYTSSLINNDASQLPAILEACVRNNQRNDVTGMLLVSQGCFFQVLEGEAAVVQETFKCISADLRHHSLAPLSEEHIHERSFPNWSMGFRQLNPQDVARFSQ